MNGLSTWMISVVSSHRENLIFNFRSSELRVSISIWKANARSAIVIFFKLFRSFTYCVSFSFWLSISNNLHTGKIVDGIGIHLLSPRLCCDVKMKRKVQWDTHSTKQKINCTRCMMNTNIAIIIFSHPFSSLKVVFSFQRETNIILLCFYHWRTHITTHTTAKHNSILFFVCICCSCNVYTISHIYSSTRTHTNCVLSFVFVVTSTEKCSGWIVNRVSRASIAMRFWLRFVYLNKYE